MKALFTEQYQSSFHNTLLIHGFMPYRQQCEQVIMWANMSAGTIFNDSSREGQAAGP